MRFGAVAPSGKLTETIPLRLEDTPAFLNFPGEAGHVRYGEGLFVGYRWYDAHHVAPAFAFGYVLSYSTFELSTLEATPRTTDGTHPIKVQFTITNTSTGKGAEVGQVYLGLPAAANEPPKRLVGFEKVTLNPGEKKRVTVTIDPAAANHPLGVWDATADAWTTVDGQYTVYVGNASNNVPLTQSITVRTPAGRQ